MDCSTEISSGVVPGTTVVCTSTDRYCYLRLNGLYCEGECAYDETGDNYDYSQCTSNLTGSECCEIFPNAVSCQAETIAACPNSSSLPYCCGPWGNHGDPECANLLATCESPGDGQTSEDCTALCTYLSMGGVETPGVCTSLADSCWVSNVSQGAAATPAQMATCCASMHVEVVCDQIPPPCAKSTLSIPDATGAAVADIARRSATHRRPIPSGGAFQVQHPRPTRPARREVQGWRGSAVVFSR
jgi:hypothetical protein